MDAGDVPSIIGGVSLLVGTVFTGWIGVGQRRTRLDQETLDENADYHRWRPRVLRAVTLLRSAISVAPGVDEPAGIDELLQWPPPQTRKHARRDEVSAGDDPA